MSLNRYRLCGNKKRKGGIADGDHSSVNATGQRGCQPDAAQQFITARLQAHQLRTHTNSFIKAEFKQNNSSVQALSDEVLLRFMEAIFFKNTLLAFVCVCVCAADHCRDLRQPCTDLLHSVPYRSASPVSATWEGSCTPAAGPQPSSSN